MAQSNNHGFRQLLASRTGLILVGLFAVAGYFLWAEHQAHILAYLPLILILGLCLGMHFFMHGGQGGGHGGGHETNSAKSKEDGK